MNIYVFGNPMLPEDAGAVNIIPALQKQFPKISFIHADPTGNWWRGDKNLTIIDTVCGIDKVTVFTSFKKIKATQSLTVHDYDLYMDLQLMKKLEKIDSFKIIGVPVTLPNGITEITEAIRKINGIPI